MEKGTPQQIPMKSMRIMRAYFEKLYSNKLENLEEMDMFF
jgi:hypothetical protein